MNNIEAHIKTVNEKLQQLLKKHGALKKENETLRNELNNLKEKEVEYKYALHELDQKVIILKAASGEMPETDKKEFEKRINQYIKEIDKCIGLLSD
jgi:predicted  nucleic acid-binding Zn-ribbon protein